MDGFQVPKFSVTQDENHVLVEAICPDAVLGSKATVAAEQCIFGFRLDPYYLPLVLPHPILDATIQPSDAANYRITLRKAQQGQLFEGLDTIQAQLLPDDQLKQAEADAEAGKGFFQSADEANRSATSSDKLAARSLLQQAMQSQGLVPMNDDDGEAKVDTITQAPSSAPKSGAHAYTYGFGLHSAQHGPLIPSGCTDPHNLLEVQDPDSVQPDDRLRTAIEYEEEHWDEGMYMESFLDQQEEVVHLLRFTPQLLPTTPPSTEETSSTDAETLCVVIQLLFAFCYDHRTNEGESTVESGWTIAKLCRSLVASVTYSNDNTFEGHLESTVIGCLRRSLTVPLYRHWQLARQCLANDTVDRLNAGRSHVMECLDQLQSLLEGHQDELLTRLAQVWIVPLTANLPSDSELSQLAQSIQQLFQSGRVTKNGVGGEAWDLEVLEIAAQQALDDGEGGFI